MTIGMTEVACINAGTAMPPGNDNINLESDELSGDLGEAVATSLRPAILDRDCAVLDPSELR
jgi:hypothetical protein